MNKATDRIIRGAPGRAAAAALALLLLTSCGFKWFESTNPDPHVPVLTMVTYGIVEGKAVRGIFKYFDAGADIEVLSMRDTGGSAPLVLGPILPPDEGEEPDLCPTGGFFFPGVSGQIEWNICIESTQLGEHTIRAWVEDSKESRSEVIEFTVIVVPPGFSTP